MKKDPWFRNRLIRDAVYRAIHERMVDEVKDSRVDPVYIMGEGSHMKIHFDAPAIEKDFPERVITLPISEDGNSNFAVGMSLAGVIPIVDVISSDFLYRTMDAICNTMAKAATVSRPRPMIVKSEFLTGGPTSGQRIEALFTHVPGLRVAVPSNPLDAYLMMHEALRAPAVTVFFEDREIPDTTTRDKHQVSFLDNSTMPRAQDWETHFRPSANHINGPVHSKGPTVVSYGVTMRIIEEMNIFQEVDLVDLRYLYPLDIELILKLTNVSRRLLVVEPDVGFMGIGAEIAAQVAERDPGCKIKRLGAPRITIPASRYLHENMIPSEEKIRAAISSMMVKDDEPMSRPRGGWAR